MTISEKGGSYLRNRLSVAWYASNTDGTSWVACSEVPTERHTVNSQWTEYMFEGSFADPAKKQVRFKAVMTGSGGQVPRIHRLGATLS